MALKIYFGVPGSGKTTHAASVVYKNLKKGRKTFSNVPIKGAYLYDSKDLGKYDISNCDLIIDEASIDFNNRQFKSLPMYTIQWLKYYRHYGVRNIYVYSQSYEDMDITLRRLATELYIVRRSLIPGLFVTKRIAVKIGIDENTHQVIDEYFFQFLGIRHYWGRLYFSMFDSWSTPELPVGDYRISGESNFSIIRRDCLQSLLPCVKKKSRARVPVRARKILGKREAG